MTPLADLGDRSRHVRAASAIGFVVAALFSVFNVFLADQTLLGLIELGAALVLVAPAYVLSHQTQRVAQAEMLLMASAFVVFGALIVLGGVGGSGLFWAYTVPFLAFFLHGPRWGWVLNLLFLALVTVYMVWVKPVVAWAYPYPEVLSTHFVLSLAFYIVVAAVFNEVRSRYEDQLRLGRNRAEAADHAKSRFLAAASHDLRQPAHALGMFVARLTQQRHDPATQAVVDGVDASVRALQDMLDAFFDYSRFDGPSLKVHKTTFPVNRVLDQLRATFAVQAAQRGLRLRVRPSSLWLDTDPVLLHRAMLNLISNALANTERGTVLVACRPTADATHARLEVWDSGVGIAPKFHDKVFEEFFQIDNPHRDRTKGLGLGLSIVVRTSRLLNMPISLRSAVGQGSRFGLRVPVVPAPAALPAQRSGESRFPLHDTLFNGLHVLLIEDDAQSVVALRGLLESWGCMVVHADSAQGVKDLLAEQPAPDIILSDYRLRGKVNGVQAVQMVRRAVGFEVPGCVISGDANAAVRQEAADVGLVLLQKPARPAKLRSVMHHLVASTAQDKG